MNIFDYISDKDLATLLASFVKGNKHTSTVSTGLAVKATSDPDFKTTASAYYEIEGVKKVKTSTATIDASGVANAPFAAQAAGKYCAYAVTLDADGTFNIYKGADAASAALAITSGYWPTIPITKCVIGYFVVTTAAGYTYQCGVTNTDATGITVASAVELGSDLVFTDLA